MHLKESDFDAHGDPRVPQVQSDARRHTQGHSAESRARLEELLQGTAKGQQRRKQAERRTRDAAGERAAKRTKLQLPDRPLNPTSSSNAVSLASSNIACPSDATAGSDDASAGNEVAGCVARDAAQETVMSGGADRRRTIPREKEDDEERTKRQRTEKKTELEMEASNVANINDSRRILDLRRDGWELENVNHRDAAMFCACELRPRVILTRCAKRTQL